MKAFVALLAVLWSVGSVAGEVLYCPRAKPPTVSIYGISVPLPQGITLSAEEGSMVASWSVFLSSAAEHHWSVKVVYEYGTSKILSMTPTYERCKQTSFKARSD